MRHVLVLSLVRVLWRRFKWDVNKLANDFSLSPTEGYIAAGMDVPFDVVFHPRDVNSDLRSEVSNLFT